MGRSIIIWGATWVALLLVLTSCQQGQPISELPSAISPQADAETSTPTLSAKPTINSSPKTEPAQDEPETNKMGLTYLRTDGNRVIPGSGGYPFQEHIDISLPGKATWLIATEVEDGIVWTAALEDGEVLSFRMDAEGSVNDDPEYAQLPAGMPPAAYSASRDYHLIQVADAEQSPLTHPVLLPGSGLRAYITKSGELRFVDENEQIIAALEANALPDARILVDEQERLLMLSDPTDRYAHGVLGDGLEASSISLIETIPEPRIIKVIHILENTVIEGISPIWTDLTGDGQREIVVTVSDFDLGAGITVLDENGSVIAEGPKMGRPYRWRHQIAVSTFDPSGDMEIAVVRTPHITGTVEFYRLDSGELSITTEVPGITSHTIGSRNLDMSLAGDFDGDNLSELLVMSPDLSELIAIDKSAQGAGAAWQIPFGGAASSNIAGATLPGGRIAVGVARNDGILRFWIPTN